MATKPKVYWKPWVGQGKSKGHPCGLECKQTSTLSANTRNLDPKKDFIDSCYYFILNTQRGRDQHGQHLSERSFCLPGLLCFYATTAAFENLLIPLHSLFVVGNRRRLLSPLRGRWQASNRWDRSAEWITSFVYSEGY